MVKLKYFDHNLIENEKKYINQIKVKEAIKLCPNKINLFMNIKDIREIIKSECVLQAKHTPRGILKFWIGTISPYSNDLLIKILILYFITPQIGVLLLLYLQLFTLATINGLS